MFHQQFQGRLFFNGRVDFRGVDASSKFRGGEHSLQLVLGCPWKLVTSY